MSEPESIKVGLYVAASVCSLLGVLFGGIALLCRHPALAKDRAELGNYCTSCFALSPILAFIGYISK